MKMLGTQLKGQPLYFNKISSITSQNLTFLQNSKVAWETSSADISSILISQKIILDLDKDQCTYNHAPSTCSHDYRHIGSNSPRLWIWKPQNNNYLGTREPAYMGPWDPCWCPAQMCSLQVFLPPQSLVMVVNLHSSIQNIVEMEMQGREPNFMAIPSIHVTSTLK